MLTYRKAASVVLTNRKAALVVLTNSKAVFVFTKYGHLNVSNSINVWFFCKSGTFDQKVLGGARYNPCAKLSPSLRSLREIIAVVGIGNPPCKLLQVSSRAIFYNISVFLYGICYNWFLPNRVTSAASSVLQWKLLHRMRAKLNLTF